MKVMQQKTVTGARIAARRLRLSTAEVMKRWQNGESWCWAGRHWHVSLLEWRSARECNECARERKRG